MAQNNTPPREIQIAASAADQLRGRRADAERQEGEELHSKQQTIAALGTLQAIGSLPQSDLQAQVLQALLENLQHDMGKKRAKEAEQEENLRRFMLARTDSIRLEKEKRALAQAYCDHKKENGRSRICGQKLSNNHYSYLCSYCHKEYDETTLPASLQVPMETIGG